MEIDKWKLHNITVAIDRTVPFDMMHLQIKDLVSKQSVGLNYIIETALKTYATTNVKWKLYVNIYNAVSTTESGVDM